MMDDFSEAMGLPTTSWRRNTLADAMDLPSIKPVRKDTPAKMGPKATKSATIPTDPGDKGALAAKEHAELAEQHGWSVKVRHEGPTWTVMAEQDGCTATVAWSNGKVDYPKVMAAFRTHEVWLKNTTQWRRQIMMPKDERPAQSDRPVSKRKVKSQPEPAAAEINGYATLEESAGLQYNITNLPFARDDEDGVIIDLIRGRTLYWRNTLAERVDHAQLPDGTKTIRISAHPRTGRRIVSFPESHGWDAKTATEVLGAERSVALDQMIRLG